MFTLVLLLALEAAPSRATVELTYRGVEQCPSEDAMREAIRRRVGYDPFQTPAALKAFIEVTPLETGLEATLRVTDAEGHETGRRQLRSKSTDCAELSSALQLALSIAIDPVLLLAPAPAIGPRAPAVVTPPAPPPPEPTGPPLILEVTAGPELAIEQGPGLGIGGALGGAIRWPRFSLGLDAHADFNTGVPIDVGRVVSSQFFASLVPCFRPSIVSLCAVAAFGAQTAAGVELVNAKSTVVPFVALGARAAIDYPTEGRFTARLQVEGLVPVTTATFTVGDMVAWQTRSFTGSIGLLAVGRF